jgi:hypothetical protein
MNYVRDVEAWESGGKFRPAPALLITNASTYLDANLTPDIGHYSFLERPLRYMSEDPR